MGGGGHCIQLYRGLRERHFWAFLCSETAYEANNYNTHSAMTVIIMVQKREIGNTTVFTEGFLAEAVLVHIYQGCRKVVKSGGGQHSDYVYCSLHLKWHTPQKSLVFLCSETAFGTI